MEVISCKSCGKLFNYISGQRICSTCNKKMEEKFLEVKKFVREHPDIELHTLSEEMDVSVAQIKRWVREERLVFSSDSPIGIPCEGCGAMIKTGRFCKNCKNTMSNDLREAAGLNKKPTAVAAPRKSTDSKMRFLD